METDAVLEWLAEHHPELHKTAEIDRNWVWLCCGEFLKGDEPEKKAIRDAIGGFGFRYARNGHPMPSGNVGIWAHSCLVPKRFAGGKPTANSKQQSKPKSATGGNRRIDPFDVQAEAYTKLTESLEPAPVDSDLAAGLAFFNS
jgi:hypothetical protein